MSGNLPSLEDLIQKKDKESEERVYNHGAQQTLTAIDRKYEEMQTAERAAVLGYEYVNLKGFPLDLEALGLIPKEEAEKAQTIAFHHESGEVKLGSVDPTSPLVDDIRNELELRRYRVRIYVISKSSFQEALESYSRVVGAKKIVSDHITLTSTELKTAARKFDALLKSKQQEILKLDATELIIQLLSAAINMDSSDIHCEPERGGTKIRFRIDGVLQDMGDIPPPTYKKILFRIKVMSHLKLNVNKTPQDGSFSITLNKKTVDFRVSVLPAVYGEALVLRILKQEQSLSFDDLGITGLARERLEEALEKTTGMILTTGPTGSGKTTTLYALLQRLNKRGTKIITIEDPVEYKIAGISQTPVDKRAGMTFASGLRAILRQDPDVVMVGEIRDHETADTAIHAALTGHVVLSTLHTNDAVGTIPRLIDLNIKPFLIVGAIKVAMAQRLVRRLCPACKHKDELDEILLKRVERLLSGIPKTAGIQVPAKLTFYTSKGCSECHGLGYKGRIGIFEAFTITPEMEKLILREFPVSALQEQAVKDGMITMMQDGLIKALQGITDVYEILRVAG